jgi:hypothetical protein
MAKHLKNDKQRSAKRGKSKDRLAKIERDVLALKALSQSIIVPVTTLSPEPFELSRPLMIVVQPDDDSFTATFFDANINASGNTQADAVANLKDLLVTFFVMLEKEKKLGKGPTRQLAVLRDVMRQKA